jgi:hypothetical protein
MKFKIILLSIFLSLLSVNIFSQNQSPKEFVQSFYKFHRASSRNFEAENLEAHKRWFTAELNKLLNKELKREEKFTKQNPDQKPRWGDGFSFAPNEDGVINGKTPKNALKIGSVTMRKNIAVVKVKFYLNKVYGGNYIDTYRIELIRINNNWLINDLIYSEGERLTDSLKREKY